MDCNSIKLANIVKDCASNIGGIRRVWLHLFEKDIFTLDSGATQVEAITATTDWYTYDFRRGTGSLTSNLTVDEASGVNFVQSDLAMQFSRMETIKRTAIASLALAEVVGIVEDMNGKYWALGVDDAMVSTAGVGQTGAARSDANSYQITLTDYSKSYPYEVSAEVIATINTGN